MRLSTSRITRGGGIALIKAERDPGEIRQMLVLVDALSASIGGVCSRAGRRCCDG